MQANNRDVPGMGPSACPGSAGCLGHMTRKLALILSREHPCSTEPVAWERAGSQLAQTVPSTRNASPALGSMEIPGT